jgi:hypothetical protein
MISVWKKNISTKSGRPYYTNILTNESKWKVPDKNGSLQTFQNESNTFIMYIPNKKESSTHRGSILRGGVDGYIDLDNMTVELYNEQNPEYPMLEFPPRHPFYRKEWMIRPGRTEEELRSYFVFQVNNNVYNRELHTDWCWIRIMKQLRERRQLSYDDLDRLYSESLYGDLYDVDHFLSEPVKPYIPTNPVEREQFMHQPNRSTEDLLRFWIFRGYNMELYGIWYLIMKHMVRRGVLSYDDLDNLYNSTDELRMGENDAILFLNRFRNLDPDPAPDDDDPMEMEVLHRF